MGSPPGSDNCDVYLLSGINDVSVFKNKGDIFSNTSYYYNRQGSRENFVSGVVDILDSNNGWQNLGFRNTELNNGVNVVLQVVAIVYNEPSSNGWTVSLKQQLYDKMKSNFSQALLGKVKSTDINNLSGCIMNKLTQGYTPQEITALAEYEQNLILAKYGESCIYELNLDFSNLAPKQSLIDDSKIIGRWQDENSTFGLMNYGLFTIQWKSGNWKIGNWKIEGDKLLLTFDSWKSTIDYKILELTNNNLKYQGTRDDTTIWNAIKLSK